MLEGRLGRERLARAADDHGELGLVVDAARVPGGHLDHGSVGHDGLRELGEEERLLGHLLAELARVGAEVLAEAQDLADARGVDRRQEALGALDLGLDRPGEQARRAELERVARAEVEEAAVELGHQARDAAGGRNAVEAHA